MNRSVSASVIIEVEYFLDRLMYHSKEQDCKHSVNDLLAEVFENKDNFKKLATGSLTQQPNRNLSNDDNLPDQMEIELK